MESKNEIPFGPIKLQRTGNYFKIAVPPDLVKEGVISTDKLYMVKLIEYKT